MIVTGVQPVGPIQQRFHLAAHFIIVNGRGESDDVGVVHFLRDFRRVVGNDAAPQLLAGHAPPAELNVPAPERDFFRVVPGIGRAPEKSVRQCVGIAVGPETGGNHQYVFHKKAPLSVDD